MGKNKSGKFKKNESVPSKKSSDFFNEDDDFMNDEIDVFHKQRDVVPLDMNEDVGSSEDDDEHPVFDLKDNEEEDDEDSDNEDDEEDLEEDKGLAAKILRQKKYLELKMGGAEDEMDDDAEEEEEKSAIWGKHANVYYNGDNADLEGQSSDEDDIAMEEAEALRMHREKVKALSMEDLGIEDTVANESDEEPTFEESLRSGKPALNTSEGQQLNKDQNTTIYEKLTKDLKALTREEQMDVVYSSAPEIVGLLSELNDSYEQLENKVDPLLIKVMDGKNGTRGGMHYLELKQLLLLSYCQAITFYLLLKSEGQSARDHPVISQLVQMKTLMDKMKELDKKIPANFEEILNKSVSAKAQVQVVEENAVSDFVSSTGGSVSSGIPNVIEPIKNSSRDHIESLPNGQDTKVGLQSMEMLKVRAALEERLKKKGVFSSLAQRDELKRNRQLLNGQLETRDDFDDDALGVDASEGLRKLSRLVNEPVKKRKIASGDDDLPQRDDIGEKRRKHELRVLATAGINSTDDVQDEIDDAQDEIDDADSDHSIGGDSDADLEVYNKVKLDRAAKLATKAGIYSRPSTVSYLPEPVVDGDGKRQISHQIEKNRGLTRSRNKDKKNPRKNNRDKYEKSKVRRKGQVREHKTANGPYGGETAGINARISRSVRF